MEKSFRGHLIWDHKKQKFVSFKKKKKVETHYVIPDEMEEIESMATPFREKFTSRSAYKRHLKEHGFVETGGEHLKEKPPVETAADREREAREEREFAEQVYMDIKYDRIPFTDKEKALHEEENKVCGKKVLLKNPY